MSTNTAQFIDDLDAGVFAEKLGKILSDVAAGVIDHDKVGNITIQLDMKRIGTSYQVAISHKLKSTKPTRKGKLTEEETTQTPMHVGKHGALSLFPENQFQMFNKTGQPQGEAK